MNEFRGARVLAALAVCSLVANSAAGAQERLTGVVVEVDPATHYDVDGALYRPTSVRIELDGDLYPQAGDPVRFEQEVPGVGLVEVAGDWTVVDVAQSGVTAIPTEAAIFPPKTSFEHPIDPGIGHRAVISTDQPRTSAQLAAAGELLDAAQSGSLARVQAMLEDGSIDAGGTDAALALGGAAVAGHVDVVRALLAAGVDPTTSIRGTNVMAEVAASDDVGLGLAALLDAGADPDIAGAHGVTPLHRAASDETTWLCTYLLTSAGADVDPRTSSDMPPYEVREGPFGEEPGRLMYRFDRAAATPLMMAAMAGVPESVAALLAAGADPSSTNGSGQSALELAEAVSCDECLELLEAPDRAAAATRDYLYDELHDELDTYGDLQRIRAVLGTGLDMGYRDSYGLGPIHWFAYDPAEGLPLEATLDLLLAAGAAVDAPGDEDGRSPLMMAAGNEGYEIATLLLARGADVNFRTVGREGDEAAGETALMMAARDGDVRMVRLLLDAGADRTARDAEGRTAADWAAEYDYLELAESLR